LDPFECLNRRGWREPKPDQNIGYADLFQHRYWHYIDLPFSRDGTPLAQPPAVSALSHGDRRENERTRLIEVSGGISVPMIT